MRFYVLSLSCKESARIYEGRPESKDRLAIKKNKQNGNKNVSLQTLSYLQLGGGYGTPFKTDGGAYCQAT
jgi:UDP-N-acetylglucosamine pyrophosphorylase